MSDNLLTIKYHIRIRFQEIMNKVLHTVPVFAVYYMCTPMWRQDGFGKVIHIFGMDQDGVVSFMLIVISMMEQVVAL